MKFGAFAEIRTPDQLIKSQLLYQLSYEGDKFCGTPLKIICFFEIANHFEDFFALFFRLRFCPYLLSYNVCCETS